MKHREAIVLLLPIALGVSLYVAQSEGGGSMAGSVGGTTISVSSLAGGDAGGGQVGLILTDIHNVTCKTDMDRDLKDGHAIVILAPQAVGTWTIPRTSAKTGAYSMFSSFDSTGSREDTEALSGSVTITEFSASSPSSTGKVTGTFSLTFPGGDNLSGSFDSSVCSEIGL